MNICLVFVPVFCVNFAVVLMAKSAKLVLNVHYNVITTFISFNHYDFLLFLLYYKLFLFVCLLGGLFFGFGSLFFTSLM